MLPKKVLMGVELPVVREPPVPVERVSENVSDMVEVVSVEN